MAFGDLGQDGTLDWRWKSWLFVSCYLVAWAGHGMAWRWKSGVEGIRKGWLERYLALPACTCRRSLYVLEVSTKANTMMRTCPHFFLVQHLRDGERGQLWVFRVLAKTGVEQGARDSPSWFRGNERCGSSSIRGEKKG